MPRPLHALLLAFLFFLGVFSTAASAREVTTVTYFHNDIAGSPLAATDAAGNVVWKESYRPYGDKLRNEPASGNGTNKIGYAGSPFDASTGLSYMGARYYDPVIGRFMGIDPVGFQEDNIHSFNRYAYANNNPYKFVDRDGRSPEQVLNSSELAGLTGQMIGANPSSRAGATAIGVQWQSEALNQASGLSLVLGAGEGVMVAHGVAQMAGPLSKLSTEALKSIIKENGGVTLLNSKGLFGSNVEGAKAALQTMTKVPEGLKAEALNAYKEIAIRNIHQEVQQIRLQIVEKALSIIGK
jgi:RHS repeat-associated protein